jgi:hypothetical protein
VKRLLHPVAREENGPTIGYMFWCPGCECGHVFYTSDPALSGGHPQWKFDGNLMCPTFEPSLRCFHTIDGRDVTICHLFVKLGRIEFCGDSPHKLAGQTVPLQPFPGDDE